ncbi:restriction endonuclease subunit S [Beggiatoa leptomitoformis]|uniref:Restriction endonuclease subunit S n=1 Tax=Beggiatoa leptomitoformis TaxID=288004 RepID=A0A2N9YC32_9GAMM|nr:restriction endonuclease subunit S [Beggiatoa leptomitoformis]ALG66638.1 restriction endonuclease subunit S [Beggiatoa leptomitoformis]AUI68045.1 restriction endonuclease subunit S [Beggiatoa leptomitoformis]
MALKAGYKQTEVGVIPVDWEVSELKDIILDMLQGVNTAIDKPEYVNSGSGIPILKANNIIDKEVRFNGADHISKKTFSTYSDRYKLKKNDFLFSNIGARLGTGSLLSVETECSFAWNVMRIIPNTNKIIPSYLSSVVNSPKISQNIKDNQSGSGMGFVPKSVMRKIKIPLPNMLEEQTAIANVLSDADALIQSLTRLIAKKRQIKQGAMQTLLNPYENGRLKAGWATITYDEAFNFLSTASFSRSELSNSGEYGYIHYGDIHTLWDGFVDFKKNEVSGIAENKAKNYVVIKDGDLIMADASEDYKGIGKSVEIKGVGIKKVISGLHTFLLRDSKNVFVDGFRGYIHSTKYVKEQLDRLATGLKVYGISKTNLKLIKIPLPPKEEQTRIATILSDMDTEINALESKLNKYQQIKQGMMQNLLTGQIRLVSPETETNP